MSRKIEDLHPLLQPLCKEFMRLAEEAEIDVLITCTYRSNAEQDSLYAQGRNGDKRPVVTNAKAGQSAHNFILNGKPASKAFDFVPVDNGKLCWDAKHPYWQRLGKIGMDLGLNWYGAPGSKFKEFPHMELPKGE